MTLRCVLCFALAVPSALLFTQSAKAASCANFKREAQVAIGSHVAALRRFELEASDRIKGLDSRPFEFLAGETRKTAEIIADPAFLKIEESLKGCRNKIQPIRKICAEAAQALLDVLGKHLANPKPDYDKPRYAAAVAECENLMDLKPLKSAIRGTQ